MMVWYVIELRKAIGVLKLDFHRIVRCLKQERGQKRVTTPLSTMQNWYSIGL